MVVFRVMTSEMKKHLAEIGRKGGRAKGESKSRGDSDYYRKLAKRSNQAKRKNSKKTKAGAR